MTSIRTQAIIVFLIVSLLSSTVVGYLSISTSQKEMDEEIRNHLISVAQSRANHLETFLKVTKVPAKIISLPYAVPWGATLAYEIISSLGLIKKGATSRAQLKWKQARVTFDNSKAKNELGWAPTISIEDGLNRTFNWYVTEYGS